MRLLVLVPPYSVLPPPSAASCTTPPLSGLTSTSLPAQPLPFSFPQVSPLPSRPPDGAPSPSAAGQTAPTTAPHSQVRRGPASCSINTQHTHDLLQHSGALHAQVQLGSVQLMVHNSSARSIPFTSALSAPAVCPLAEIIRELRAMVAALKPKRSGSARALAPAPTASSSEFAA